jgi:hypothetical protein
VHRVGFEPTCCPGKNRVQSSFATDASRAALTRDPCQRTIAGIAIVPPSGIEPDPLGLQPSAQTNYARVGYERRARFEARAAQIIIIVLRLSESGMRRAGAPRAFMRSRLQRAHLGRRCSCRGGGRTYRDSRSGLEISIRKIRLCVRPGEGRPETSKGRPVFPLAALQRGTCVCTLRDGGASAGTRIQTKRDVARARPTKPHGLHRRGRGRFRLIMET